MDASFFVEATNEEGVFIAELCANQGQGRLHGGLMLGLRKIAVGLVDERRQRLEIHG